MKASAGRLFEQALSDAEIDLKPGSEFNVKVQKKGAHLRLVVGPTNLTEFEASILGRSRRASENLQPYKPKLPVGKRIRVLRKAAGLTLEDLASKAEMSKGSLCSIEKGERPVGLGVLRKIAKAINCSVSSLVD